MAQVFKMIGLIRFSVLTPTFNADQFDTLEDAASVLYAPERMEHRLRLFEHLCLPSLLRQSDPEFDVIVLTGKQMPDVYLERLYDLLDPHENMVLRPVSAGNHFQLISQAYGTVPRHGETHRILFRLDDDDALDVNYVARTKRLAAGLCDLQGPDVPFVIAYNRGIYLKRGQDGQAAEVFDACERAPLSAGTALVKRAGTRGNPYRYNHRRFGQHYNLFSDISVPGFIRTIHWDNHSDPAIYGEQAIQSDAELDQDLIQHFNLSLHQLKAL